MSMYRPRVSVIRRASAREHCLLGGGNYGLACNEIVKVMDWDWTTSEMMSGRQDVNR